VKRQMRQYYKNDKNDSDCNQNSKTTVRKSEITGLEPQENPEEDDRKKAETEGIKPQEYRMTKKK